MDIWENKDLISKYVSESNTISEVLIKMGFKAGGMTRQKVNKLIEEWDISTDHFTRKKVQQTSVWYDEDRVRLAVTNSLSIAEVVRNMGLSVTGTAYSAAKRAFDRFDLDTSHFDSGSARLKELKKSRTKIPLTEILEGGHPQYSTNDLKKRLFAEGVFEEKCDGCGICSIWNGNSLTLQLDHINGVSNDHRKENLRILCPNCHSQTKTFGGRNNKYKT